MDAPVAGTAAWLVLGAVLGLLLAAAVAAWVLGARRRRAPGPGGQVGPEQRVDDLADFLEHPPGTRSEPAAPTGWAALSAPPPPAPAAPRAAADPGYRPVAVLALVALALVGCAAAVAAAARALERADAGRPAASGPAPSPSPPGLAGRLTAAGLVLEQRAVGITAAYPELELSSTGDGGTRLELRLPTWNCLAAEPPADPAAAGCVPSLVEHAELSSPGLTVQRDGDRMVLRGPAATELRPSGSAPEPTGRVYDLTLSVVADGGRAAGELRVGSGTATVTGGLSGR
ncbi:hypothetical protein [Blastococcus sp. TF02A-35]|uniref:hypothetical protein n=1 Tax=Blastococcus sp. TF02A-35 TaxID=2559612 RepID=UPI0010731AB7|nr:hypothetical protein [Blastococcus sp. TF02A_35]